MLITNFDKKDFKKYNTALKQYRAKTKDTELYIDRNAYFSNGSRNYDAYALRSNGYKILTEFWEIFDRIS